MLSSIGPAQSILGGLKVISCLHYSSTSRTAVCNDRNTATPVLAISNIYILEDFVLVCTPSIRSIQSRKYPYYRTPKYREGIKRLDTTTSIPDPSSVSPQNIARCPSGMRASVHSEVALILREQYLA